MVTPNRVRDEGSFARRQAISGQIPLMSDMVELHHTIQEPLVDTVSDRHIRTSSRPVQPFTNPVSAPSPDSQVGMPADIRFEA
jgi:hypothetical protein